MQLVIEFNNGEEYDSFEEGIVSVDLFNSIEDCKNALEKELKTYRLIDKNYSDIKYKTPKDGLEWKEKLINFNNQSKFKHLNHCLWDDKKSHYEIFELSDWFEKRKLK